MDIIHEENNGDIEAIILLNFMVEVDWMLNEVPLLRRKDIPVLILHGLRDNQDPNTGMYSLHFSNEEIHEYYSKYNILLRQIKVDDPYGTAHAKAALIFYKAGIRVAIHTANYIEMDLNYKTQGVYVQDFPLLSARQTPSKHDAFPFGTELFDFLQKMEIFDRSAEDDKTTTLKVDAKRMWREYRNRIHQYDFSTADVVLIPAVPGRWKGVDSEGKSNLHKYGHTKLKRVLEYYHASAHSPAESNLIVQISSIGSMGKDEKKLSEIVSSMGSTLGSLQILWPTVECVRTSCIGYRSGGSIPCSQETLFENGRLKETYARCMYKWAGNSPSRTLYTPHIKTYFKYKTSGSSLVQLDWFLLTSSNLSQAAWGVLEKDGTQLFLKSFELGVLFVPQRVKTPFRVFSLTPTHPLLGFDADSTPNTLPGSPRRFVVSMELAREVTDCSDIHFPIPFQIPPVKYSGTDVPWTSNTLRSIPDRFGLK